VVNVQGSKIKTKTTAQPNQQMQEDAGIQAAAIGQQQLLTRLDDFA